MSGRGIAFPDPSPRISIIRDGVGGLAGLGTRPLSQELTLVRGLGVGVDGERIPDGYGIAVPYFAQHTVDGSITATIPRHRADEIDIDTVRKQLAAAALSITHLLSV
ncbi:IclR family transcriptional regulator [[Kitasatospora] papulosa]|uniref:hypothetical protein n=1 Tax=[Kitasatospora] papulosa TaxID=1464011 RepID=UPI003823DA03